MTGLQRREPCLMERRTHFDNEQVSPLPPQPGKGDPERSIERAQSRSRPFLGIDRELLPECQLDDGLFLTTPEEGAQAVEKSD